MHPLLSICIPTYNRAEYLREALDSLYLQVEKFKNFVEIIISDNASTDSTYDTVLEYQGKANFSLYYNRNEENIGLVGNFNKSVSFAKGKYIFLMGDDDIFSPSFLDTIMPYLQSEEEYGLVHWGRLGGNENCTNNSLHNPYFTRMVSIDAPPIFIKETLSAPNFISSVLMHKKVWELGSKYEDSNLPGYGQFARMLWGAIEFNKPCVHLYMPLIIQRNPIRVWQKNWPIFLLYEMNMIFFNIDSKVEGLYQLWQNRLRDVRFYNIEGVIVTMCEEAKFYQPYYFKIAEHLSVKEQKWLKMALFHPKMAKVYFKFKALAKRINKFLH